MSVSVQNELEIIKQCVLKIVQAQTMYLFGSYAYGTPNEDSDLDVYIVIPDGDVDPLDITVQIRKELYKKKTMPLDLIIRKQAQFNKRVQIPSLERLISEKGVIFYGQKTSA